jgi:hypothetical protein
LRLDFEKGPIHPSPLGPSILTIGESNHGSPQVKSPSSVVHNDSEEQSKEHLVLLLVHTLISNQDVCSAL